jgi:hypothetical protein
LLQWDLDKEAVSFQSGEGTLKVAYLYKNNKGSAERRKQDG